VDTPTASLFFALLALAGLAGTVATVVLVVAAHRAPPGSGLVAARDDLAAAALWLGFLVALVTTLGSLYYSEVAHFVPCRLCWYQRIAMYPLTLTLLVAALRRDRSAWTYVAPPALVGAGFAAYHAQLQAFPSQGSSFCTVSEPCTVRYVWELGFVSLPLMALAGFAFVLTMVLLARSAPTPAPNAPTPRSPS
jgi:disulfide bond formation protein DsbB